MDFQLNYSDDEEDQEYSSQWQTTFRDGLLFLIDCSEEMFEKNGEETHFELAMKCVMNVMKNKIISSERDLISVVFYATEIYADEFKNVYELEDLHQPGADLVRKIQNILKDGTEKFIEEYGQSKTYSLADAFWACSTLFSKCTYKLGSQRIMLFTNNDDPHRDKLDLQRQTKKRAEDLKEAGVELELMHMATSGRGFDVSQFYKDCIFYAEGEDTATADPAQKFEELLTRVRAKDHKKRSLGKVLFSLGQDINMSVGIYNLVRTCTKPSAIKLYGKSNEEVKSLSKSYLAETGEILMPQDLKRAALYEGRKVSFEVDEMNEMKKLAPKGVGIKLLGFKPRDKLKRYHHSRPAQFIYPEEGMVKGSTTMFTALLMKCLEKEVIALCLYAPRKTSDPKFVALVPQAEELDEHKVQITPPGFHVIFLPFADDFRALKLENMNKASDDQIAKAKDLVKKLRFPFQSESFENPALQKHYVNVEALALDNAEVDEIDDYTDPDVDAQETRAGKVIQEFKDLVFPEGYDGKSSKKRTAGTGAGAATKRPKLEAPDVNVEGEARAGRINKLTVVILKQYVKSNNLTCGTKKQELIDAINLHLGL